LKDEDDTATFLVAPNWYSVWKAWTTCSVPKLM